MEERGRGLGAVFLCRVDERQHDQGDGDRNDGVGEGDEAFDAALA